MLLASAALHVMVLMSVKGALTTAPGSRIKGTPLPPLVIEVVIRTPDILSERKIPTIAEPQKPEAAVSLPSKPDAPRLLTPLPIPVEKIGAENLPMIDDLGLIPTDYFPASALTARPRPTTEPEIELPKGWLEAFGQARLTLYVSEAGVVDAVVLHPINLAPELHDAVRTAFQRLTFTPGAIDGRAVSSVMTIEVDISLALNKLR